MNDIKNQKQKLRKKFCEQRERLDETEYSDLNAALCHQAQTFLKAKTSSQVFLFYSHRREPNLIEISKSLPTKCALPVIDTKTKSMEFYLWHYGDPVIKNVYGIYEPKHHDLAQRIFPDDQTIVLVPALAIDKNGYRLGFGGGYYDRFLANKKRVYTVGIVFSNAFIDRLPIESFDIRLSACVTDKEIILFKI